MMYPNTPDEEARPADLLMTIEQFRMEMRDSVNPYKPRSLLEHDYMQIRSALLRNPTIRHLLPDWLRLGTTLDNAVNTIKEEVHSIRKEVGGGRNFVARNRQLIEDSLTPLIDFLQSQALSQGTQATDLVSRRIQVRVNGFFRAKISIENRAIQALSRAPQSNSHRIETLWRNIILFYPAVAAMLEQALPRNVDYTGLIHYLSIGTDIKGSESVSDKFIMPTLSRCFHKPRSDHLTQYAEQLRTSGKLSAVDLLVGPMKGPLRSVHDIPPVSFAVRTNREQLSDSGAYWEYVDALMNNLTSSFAMLDSADPSCGDQQFALVPDGAKLRLVPFGTWTYCLSPDKDVGPGEIYRGNAVQSLSFFSRDSLAELEDLINANALEREFQKFFEMHQEYLLALGPYSKILPQVVLTENTGNRLIPDFFLENFHSGFCDICDLKRPSELLLKTNRGRPQFRDSVMAAVRQLNDYRDYFEDGDNRRRFEATYKGLRAFRPRVILVIGRREGFYDELDRIRLKSELRDSITLHTYDDVVASARRWQTHMCKAILH